MLHVNRRTPLPFVLLCLSAAVAILLGACAAPTPVTVVVTAPPVVETVTVRETVQVEVPADFEDARGTHGFFTSRISGNERVVTDHADEPRDPAGVRVAHLYGLLREDLRGVAAGAADARRDERRGLRWRERFERAA